MLLYLGCCLSLHKTTRKDSCGSGGAAGNFIPSETLIKNFSKTFHVGLLHFTALTGQSLIKGVSPTPNKKGWESPF